MKNTNKFKILIFCLLLIIAFVLGAYFVSNNIVNSTDAGTNNSIGMREDNDNEPTPSDENTSASPKGEVIQLYASKITLKVNDEFDPYEYVKSANSEEYGDVLSKVKCVTVLNTAKAGDYKIEYKIDGIDELKDEVAILNVTVK